MKRLRFAFLSSVLVLTLIVSMGTVSSVAEAAPSPNPSPSSRGGPTLFGRKATPLAAAAVPNGFRDERVAGGIDLPAQHQLGIPTGMAFLPDGRILVTEKAGKLRLVKNNLVVALPAIDLTAQVSADGDGGLIGVAVDPDFATNGAVYLTYTNATPREGRVSRFTMTGDTAIPSSEAVLLSTIADGVYHMIDSVRIGADGLLYASDGDSSPFDQATVNSTRSQQPDKTVGKIFRMTRDGQGLPSNPFWTGNPNDPASKVMAVGLRNPFRFTVRPTGEVIVGDVGWNSWEEIDAIPATGGNKNYGWPCYEGGASGSQTQPAFAGFPVCQSLLPKGTGAVTAPRFAYDHTVGSSVTGGPVYDGTAFPSAYRGAYFFADYVKNWINYWPMSASGAFVGQPIRFGTVPSPVDIAVGPDGALYYVSILEGQIRRIAYGSPSACAPGNYFAQYYTNTTWAGTPAIARCDDTIDNAWASGGPFGSTPVDNFSVNWSGTQYFTKGATTLASTSDDGMRVWVDGQLVIDNNGIHGAVTKTATVMSTASGFRSVLVRYYEVTGQAVAKVSITSANKRPVPVITQPAGGTLFSSNQVIAASGSATDPEDGTLAGSSLLWSTILHHCPPQVPGSASNQICHTHPYSTFTGPSGTVTAPDTSGDWVWLEITLTAVDSVGAGATTRSNIFPNLCSSGKYSGRYYTNRTWSGAPAITRCDNAIDFNWGTGGPFGASPVDQYSAEWHGPRFFPAGSSTLSITSDDGSAVWVDGQLVIDNNAIQPATTKTAKVTYSAAGYHDVFVRYYEAAGYAVARFAITTP
jgi:glucose/arabinose dehydrogenase